jgi:uncharacterized protein HemY
LRQSVAGFLEEARGPFIEFWEELEGRAIEGDGESSARALVGELRGRLQRCRIDLLLASGRNALWRNQAGGGVTVLEEAFALRPDDDDASALAEAYEKVGRTAEAREMRESRRQ